MITIVLQKDDGSIQKGTRFYTGSGRSFMSSLRDDRVRVPCLNALKFLEWGARMVEEKEVLELGDGLPGEMLQEPCYDGE